MGHRGDVNPPVQLHVRLLQLLVMFASEREVMDDAVSVHFVEAFISATVAGSIPYTCKHKCL